jgi:uncharacterized protein YxjI
MTFRPDEEEERQPPPGRKFVMRDDMFTIGEDYWIEDDSGRKAYHVDGKAMRLRDTFVLEDASGREVASIKEKRLTVRDKMKIERDGRTIATVRREVGWGDRYQIDLEGGDELHAKGKIVKREMEIERDGRKIAEISKKWFRIRDSYGVEIDGTEDEALILAAIVAMEALGPG